MHAVCAQDWRQIQTDALLSSREEDGLIWVKFWRNSGELLRVVVVGHLVICYAVRTTVFNGQVELMNFDETSIEVTEISCNLARRMRSGLEANTNGCSPIIKGGGRSVGYLRAQYSAHFCLYYRLLML